MNKRVFIIHGWESHPKDAWLPWLKKELERQDIKVSVPAMPSPRDPKIKTWVAKIKKEVGEPDENTYFVGHSIGCQAILRYLEKLGSKRAGGAVLVAGWFHLRPEAIPDDESKEIAKPWVKTSIDFEKVRKAADNFTAILSDNDPYIALEEQNIFKEKLGAKIIVEKNKGHFSRRDSAKELSSALNSLLEIMKAGAAQRGRQRGRS
jgi:hypothetical protein